MKAPAAALVGRAGQRPSFSFAYTSAARTIWRWLLPQLLLRADSRTMLMAGNSMPARMAMIEITTRSSIRVKPCRRMGEEVMGGLRDGMAWMESAVWEWMRPD